MYVSLKQNTSIWQKQVNWLCACPNIKSEKNCPRSTTISEKPMSNMIAIQTKRAALCRSHPGAAFTGRLA
jgi:hypothetical protein